MPEGPRLLVEPGSTGFADPDNLALYHELEADRMALLLLAR